MFAAVAQWRVAHPQAPLDEIEQAVDEQINRLRARRSNKQHKPVQQPRVKSARDWCVSNADSPCKPGDERNGGGKRKEGKRSKWNAPMSVARSVEAGFPLDQELQVPDGHLLPHAALPHQNLPLHVCYLFFSRFKDAATRIQGC